MMALNAPDTALSTWAYSGFWGESDEAHNTGPGPKNDAMGAKNGYTMGVQGRTGRGASCRTRTAAEHYVV
jgi:hypothetical protein